MTKKTFLAVLVLGLVVAVQAAPVVVDNYSFELPGSGKIKGWNGESGADVPGWVSDGQAVDSGVESDWPGHTDGLWTSFIMQGDPTIYNLTGHAIAAGEVFTLQVDARDNWTDGDADLMISLYYDVAGVRNTVASSTFTLDAADVWMTYSLTFAANDTPAAIGNLIGIEIDNVSPSASSWQGLDNVRLDVIPEPATMLLMGLGATALIRKRK
ncbi:MAG: PEP-CTERM sorting domain-containing protein [Sedimentisphaerales bacterium]|nr:PEP-CTERM sorting domain-containing protein [Sedimentisphaerales bacterium]